MVKIVEGQDPFILYSQAHQGPSSHDIDYFAQLIRYNNG